MADTARISELGPYVCIPCSRGEHHQCRPEWECGCNHLRDLTPISTAAPAAATNQPLRRGADEVAAAGGTVEDGEVSATPPPGLDDIPLASGPGAPLWPRPDWWGEHGCRWADDPSHVCLDINGRPPEHGRPCATEARAAMADLFRQYQVPGPIAHGAEEVATRLYEHLAPMDRAVGQ